MTDISQKQGGWTPGQWAVWDGTNGYFGDPRYEANEIVKVTEKTVTLKLRHTGPYRKDAAAILWFGTEADATALAQRLSSSVGLMKDEIRRSRERHAERAAKLLSRANPSTDQGGE